ncbi:hypothetical protein CFE53_00080 [Methanofervidicoccus sp. A16]|uniref:DUF1786 domain-containing protein n=1 Tax=Methanofervidicoccus sp. A16 TaxID=2607662 RepID=UPI00118CA1B7|nr:DUF1786 domain-containing protein [Methanofervidicoccus sp. A16]AXI25847.1 hypothetical protein CFE53_00080 [Methanofervidicoccus sp. A16]
MNIMCIDIGKGTQDILYLDMEKSNIENAIKLILPSPTRIIADKILKMEKDLKIDGKVMGGGPVNRAIFQHIEKGYKVIMTKRCARTVRDDLEEVSKRGIILKDAVDCPDVILRDLDFEMFKKIFREIGVEFRPDIVGVACQDHGYIKGQSDRITRFNYFREQLRRSSNPLEYIIVEEEGIFSRFKSILETLRESNYKGFVMDSKMASICGILDYAIEEGIEEFIGLDIGNGHTLGVSIKDGKIKGIFEHHTGMLTPEKLKDIVDRLAEGSLRNEDIYEDGGHGAVVLEGIEPQEILITGPNREMFKRYGRYAYPGGDVMITGCVGLLGAFEYNREKLLR